MLKGEDGSRRLLLVTHYFAEQGGGIERVAAQLARHLGGNTRITWAASNTCALRESPKCVTQCCAMTAWDGIQRATGAPWPVWSLPSIVKLWRLVGEASLVHLHDCLYMGNVFAYLFARMRRRPVVVTQHVSDVPFKSPVLKFALWLAYQSAGRIVLGGADQVVFISEEVRQDFARRFSFKREPRFIPNGVDANLFCSVDDRTRAELRQGLLGELSDRKIFLFVGRFVEKKGLTVLQKIAAAMPQSLFVLLGQGPVDPREWKLENVRVIGALSQNELVRYYQSADMLVLPSVGEGLPLVVQEAMSTGLPVAVSSRTARADSKVTEYVYQAPCTDELDEAEVASRWIAMLEAFCAEASPTGVEREALRQIAVNRWSWVGCAAQYTELFDAIQD